MTCIKQQNQEMLGFKGAICEKSWFLSHIPISSKSDWGGGTAMTLKFKFTSDRSADRLVLQNGYVMQHFKNKSAFVARCIDVEAPRCELWQLLLILDLFRLQSQRDQEIHSTISVSSSHRHDDSPALISNANSPPVELCVDLMPSQHEAAAHWLVAEDRSDTRRTSVCFSVEY